MISERNDYSLFRKWMVNARENGIHHDFMPDFVKSVIHRTSRCMITGFWVVYMHKRIYEYKKEEP